MSRRFRPRPRGRLGSAGAAASAPLRSVGARLSLALLLVVAIALGLVYGVVVPSLHDRLVNGKIEHLQAAAPRVARAYANLGLPDPDFFDSEAAKTNARVTLLSVNPGPPLTVLPEQDSAVTARDVINDPLALRAASTGRQAHGVVTRKHEKFAEVAQPIPSSGVEIVLLSTPLHDALADVDLVQRRLVLAGVIALAVALLIGYLGARMFARRIRRLERAAERIASGRFDEAVVDPSQDELGQLARAFDSMRERLARLDHARREFVANASHELRTPVFSLGGFLELLEDEELDEPTRREFLETMSEQVRRLAKLAEELLDLSRLDAGRIRVAREPLDLAEVAEVTVEEFAGVAKATSHPLELARNGATPALGDEERALQIARILVENALVHTPPETLVRISAAVRDGRAVLEVEDEGPGIDPEDVQHLFDRFYRGGGTKASGSGLGLAIAKELAEVMDGEIELETRAGRTVFTLALPRHDP